MRCPPEKRRPTICGFVGGWLLPAAVLFLIEIPFKGSLWRPGGGEEVEDFLHERNCGQLRWRLLLLRYRSEYRDERLLCVLVVD
jgi:hypothetical protein